MKHWARDRRGVTAMVVALSFMALAMAAAVSIDLGSIFLNARRLQGIADLAAMSAAQGLTTGVTDAADIAAAQSAAVSTVSLNPWPYTDNTPAVATAITPGVYTPDPTQPVTKRFVPTNTTPNAVRVTLTAPVHLLFVGLFLGSPTLHISRSATAASIQLAAFSIGSGLASLNGGLANALLSALTGSSVSLSVMDYNSLLGAKVDLLTYLTALSTRLNLTAGSYNSLLSGKVTLPTALAALGDALGASGQSASSTAANKLVGASVSLPALQLSALFDLGPYGNQGGGNFATGGAAVSLNALSLINALLTAANGQHQIQLNLGATIPGLTALTAYLAIGQRPSNSPWITITQSNSVIVSTAQTRLYLMLSVLPPSNSIPNVPNPGLVNLSIFVELASAQAKLAALHCAGDVSQQSMTLSVLPSLGTIAIAQVKSIAALQNFTQPVPLSPVALLNAAPLAQATLFTQITLGGGSNSWQTITFTSADIQNLTMKSVSTPDLLQATLSSLLSSTMINVTLLDGLVNLPIVTAPIGQALGGLLYPLAGTLDGVVDQLTGLLGVKLGNADVWANGLRCHGAALVA